MEEVMVYSRMKLDSYISVCCGVQHFRSYMFFLLMCVCVYIYTYIYTLHVTHLSTCTCFRLYLSVYLSICLSIYLPVLKL